LHAPKDNLVDFTTAQPLSASFLNSNERERAQILALVGALADPVRRRDVARRLAMQLGAEDLIVFIKDTDPEVEVLLPAPGFPQTIPQGRVWQAFLGECVRFGQHTAELPFPDAATKKQATGIASGEHAVLVLLGGNALSVEVMSVAALLPLLQAAFCSEQAAHTAKAAVDVARKTAEEARALATVLDGVRGELQRALAETDTIIEAIPDVVVVCDTRGQIVRSNANGVDLLGLTAEEAQNPLTVYTLCNLNGTPLSREDYPLTLALRGITRTDYRFLLRRNDTGIGMQFLFSAAPIRNSTGEITGAVAVATNITELYRLERQKDEFLGIASHELKTPLTTLKGLAQLARRSLERTGSAEAKYMEIMELSIARMQRLISDFLDVSRIDADKLPLRLERYDLVELCKQIVEEQFVATGRHIHLDLPGEAVEVEVDPERIDQVITNLLSNALKYSRAGVSVMVRLFRDADSACISVHDEGIGIPAEALPLLFERFYRVPGTEVQTGSEVGLGLGLYICRTIVERHHGKIGVQSMFGQGSTFWFKLPLASEK
jgi:PAS domain S-box-containing protein